MPNPHLQIHSVFIPMTSRVIIWDFRLRPPARKGHRGLRPGGIADLWNRYALSIFKKTERSETTLRHSLFDIRYSAVRFSLVMQSKDHGLNAFHPDTLYETS